MSVEITCLRLKYQCIILPRRNKGIERQYCLRPPPWHHGGGGSYQTSSPELTAPPIPQQPILRFSYAYHPMLMVPIPDTRIKKTSDSALKSWCGTQIARSFHSQALMCIKKMNRKVFRKTGPFIIRTGGSIGACVFWLAGALFQLSSKPNSLHIKYGDTAVRMQRPLSEWCSDSSVINVSVYATLGVEFHIFIL